MAQSISISIDSDTGYLILPVTVRNKHGVKFDVKAKLDTGRRIGEISYRIYSALGLETDNLIINTSKASAINNSAHAWVGIEFSSGILEFEGDFIINELDNDLDLLIGMNWLLKFFKLSVDPSKGTFELKTQ